MLSFYLIKSKINRDHHVKQTDIQANFHENRSNILI